MRQCLHIFRKDLAAHWPGVAGILAVRVVALLLEHSNRDNPAHQADNFMGFVAFLFPTAMGLLLALVLQEEPACGGREFWMTRPYDWRSLLAAKTLFALLCINVPAFVLDAISVSWTVSISDAVSYLLWRQLVLFGWLLLGSVAFRAVSTDLARYLALVLLAGGLMAALLLQSYVSRGVGPFGYYAWLQGTAQLPLFAASAATVLVLQYSLRRAWLSRGVLVVGIAAAILIPSFLPVKAVVRAHALLPAARPDVLNFQLDPGPQPLATIHQMNGALHILVPLKVSALPSDVEVASDIDNVVVETADGTPVWRSGWGARAGIYGDAGRMMADIWADEKPFTNGDEKKMTIRLDAAVTVFAVDARRVVATAPGTYSIPGVGHCRITGWFPLQPIVDCTYVPGPNRVVAQVEHAGQDTKPAPRLIITPSRPMVTTIFDTASARAARSLLPLLPTGDATAQTRVVFIKQTPVAHLSREIVIRNLQFTKRWPWTVPRERR